jgi:hypothetical protein
VVTAIESVTSLDGPTLSRDVILYNVCIAPPRARTFDPPFKPSSIQRQVKLQCIRSTRNHMQHKGTHAAQDFLPCTRYSLLEVHTQRLYPPVVVRVSRRRDFASITDRSRPSFASAYIMLYSAVPYHTDATLALKLATAGDLKPTGCALHASCMASLFARPASWTDLNAHATPIAVRIVVQTI